MWTNCKLWGQTMWKTVVVKSTFDSQMTEKNFINATNVFKIGCFNYLKKHNKVHIVVIKCNEVRN